MNATARRLTFLIAVLLVAVAAASPAVSAPTRGPDEPVVIHSVRNDTSPALRTIPPKLGPAGGIVSGGPALDPAAPTPNKPPHSDPALQLHDAVNAPDLSMPAVGVSFEGMDNVALGVGGTGPVPPDTNGDVGPNHYVQMVNSRYQIFERDGTSLLGPANINTLFTGFGGPCEATNSGDPIVIYDQLADRWMLSQFALTNGAAGTFHQCIAVSQTADPTGSYHRYQFDTGDILWDYPKFGMWPDGYYMSAWIFTNNDASFTFAGVGAMAFERTEMLAGNAAQAIVFTNANLATWLPSDLDGTTLPPDGSPNYFVAMDNPEIAVSTTTEDLLRVYKFHADWVTTANSTFVASNDILTDDFDAALCNFAKNCIPQPGTANGLDTLASHLMFRLAYRNFGDHESLVVNHSVDIGADQAGVRWYELRNPGGTTPTIHQQGTYAGDAADSLNRWMGSIAMDGNGNMALGYSRSGAGAGEFPGIYYTGRLAGDPFGTLPQGEATLVAGGGSQTSSSNRWGDYSSMSLDPTDDCTFWFTTEYYAATGLRNWKTKIASFKFPSCDIAAAPTATIEAPATTTSLDVPVSVGGTDNSAVTGYFVSADSTPPTAEAVGWVATPPTSVTVVGPDGTKTVYGWTKDINGNVSPTASDTTTLDTTPPTATLALPDFTNTATVPLTLAGAGGVTGYFVSESATPPLPDAVGWVVSPTATFLLTGTDGTKTVNAWTKDVAGNISATASDTTILDRVKPSATLNITPLVTRILAVPLVAGGSDVSGVNGWRLSTSSAPPSPSAAGWLTTKPTRFVLPSSTNGVRRVYLFTRDRANNVSLAASDTVFLDTKAPAITVGSPPPPAPLASLTKVSGRTVDPTPSSGLKSGSLAIRRKQGTVCSWWSIPQQRLIAGACGASLGRPALDAELVEGHRHTECARGIRALRAIRG